MQCSKNIGAKFPQAKRMKPIKRTKHFELGTDSKKGKNELLGNGAWSCIHGSAVLLYLSPKCDVDLTWKKPFRGMAASTDELDEPC